MFEDASDTDSSFSFLDSFMFCSPSKNIYERIRMRLWLLGSAVPGDEGRELLLCKEKNNEV